VVGELTEKGQVGIIGVRMRRANFGRMPVMIRIVYVCPGVVVLLLMLLVDVVNDAAF